MSGTDSDPRINQIRRGGRVVAAPLVAIAVGPGAAWRAGLSQVMVAAAAIAVASVAGRSPGHLLVAASLAGTVVWVAYAAAPDHAALNWPRRWSWGSGILVVVAAGPWLVYAGASAAHGTAGETTYNLGHWPIQAALGVAIIGVAALAATLPSGWVVPAWCAGTCAVWLGVVAVTYP